jgi:hypothetical protein
LGYSNIIVGELLLVNRLVTAGLMHSRRWMIIPTLMSCSNASIDVDPSSRRPTLTTRELRYSDENPHDDGSERHRIL